MTIMMFAVLTALCAYLGIRLHALHTENSALRTNIAQLKRRLSQRD